jgi:thioredoxin-like negative regulator of GroEL
MRMLTHLIAAGLALGTCCGAIASTTDSGYTEIARGDYTAAEQRLSKEQRLFRHEPDLMLNMAYVYAQTGRIAQARALYRSVLTMPDEVLDMPQGNSMASHDLARAALSRLNGAEFTLR